MKKIIIIVLVTMSLLTSFITPVIGFTKNNSNSNNSNCEPIELTKKIWDNETSTWVNEIEAEINQTIRFNVSLTYHDTDGDGPLKHIRCITIRDELPEGLEFVGNSTRNPTNISQDKKTITWDLNICVILEDNESFYLEFDTKTINFGLQTNLVNVTAEQRYPYNQWLSKETTAFVDVKTDIQYKIRDVDDDGSMEKAIDTNQIEEDGFENFTDTDEIENRSVAVITIDGDFDEKMDHFIDINNDSIPDVYWDPDNDILTNIIQIDVDYDNVNESVFDSDDNGALDTYYDPNVDENNIRLYVTHILNITKTGNGTVNKQPNGTIFLHNFTVKIKAQPDEGWYFKKWTGDIDSETQIYIVKMNKDKNITANFKKGENPTDTTKPKVNITKPKEKTLYRNNEEIRRCLFLTRVVGPIDVNVTTSDDESGIDRVEFYVNNNLKSTVNYTDPSTVFNWTYNETNILPKIRKIKVISYDNAGNNNTDQITILKMGNLNLFRKYPNLKYVIAGLTALFVVGGIIKGTTKDTNNQPDSDETTETDNTAPVADAEIPEKGKVSQEIKFDGSKSNDKDNNIVKYEWDFGDGNTKEGKTSTHTYQEKGVYTVTLKVTDSKGESNTFTTGIEILSSNKEGGSDDEDNIFWYVSSTLGTGLLASVGLLFFRRKLYV